MELSSPTGSVSSQDLTIPSDLLGITCLRIGQFKSTGSIKLKKWGVTETMSLSFAILSPADSSSLMEINSSI